MNPKNAALETGARARLKSTATATLRLAVFVPRVSSLARTSAQQRALAVYCLKDDTLEIHGDAWVAPNATVVGKMQIKGASVWFGATVRGSTEQISVACCHKLMNVLHTYIQIHNIVYRYSS